MSKNVFSDKVVHTVIASEFVARKAAHTTKMMSFAARIQTAVMEVDEPWDFAAKAASILPKKEQALFRELLAHIESVYAPAREQAEADSIWPEVWAGEWSNDDPDTIWDQRWHAARRDRLESFRAAFAQLFPVWVTEVLKRPLY